MGSRCDSKRASALSVSSVLLCHFCRRDAVYPIPGVSEFSEVFRVVFVRRLADAEQGHPGGISHACVLLHVATFDCNPQVPNTLPLVPVNHLEMQLPSGRHNGPTSETLGLVPLSAARDRRKHPQSSLPARSRARGHPGSGKPSRTSATPRNYRTRAAGRG